MAVDRRNDAAPAGGESDGAFSAGGVGGIRPDVAPTAEAAQVSFDNTREAPLAKALAVITGTSRVQAPL